MPEYIAVPPSRIDPDVLRALLEEYVTRDGTDYGSRERSLEEKVDSLAAQLGAGEVCILYHIESEQLDLRSREDAARLTAG